MVHDPFGEQEEMRRELEELIRQGKVIQSGVYKIVKAPNGDIEFLSEAEWKRRQEVKILEELEKELHREPTKWERICRSLRSMITLLTSK